MLLPLVLIQFLHAPSRHLDCQPAVIDAKNFSPQLRRSVTFFPQRYVCVRNFEFIVLCRRLFWGNIPGLFTVHEEQLTQDGEPFTLEKSLMPNSGRRAAQDKIRTLTTNTNSLLQGRTENCKSSKDLASLFPVRISFQQDELKGIEKQSKKDCRKGKNVDDPRPALPQSVLSFKTDFLFQFVMQTFVLLDGRRRCQPTN